MVLVVPTGRAAYNICQGMPIQSVFSGTQGCAVLDKSCMDVPRFFVNQSNLSRPGYLDMGILEQLRTEAAKKQRDQFSQKELDQQLAANYRRDILPRMQQAFRFMKELIDHLNFLEHAIEVENYSDLYPQFGRLKQTNYKINTDGIMGFTDINKLMQINVSYSCVGEGEFYLPREGNGAIEREISFLHEKKLNFDWKPLPMRESRVCTQFRIQRSVPVFLRFEVDYQQSKIKLQIRNHFNFDVFDKVFLPEEINDELLDEVARFMLRKDHDFIRLSISSEHLQDIRQRLEQHKREQDALQRWIQQEDSEFKPREDKPWLARLLPSKKRDG